MTKSNSVRLGVNIDHVATLRNVRGTNYPDPLEVAKLVKKAGADGITAHLREDRRHITDSDVVNLKNKQTLPLNLEMAVTEEMQKIALNIKPNAVCLVPEKREERTTEGGLRAKEMGDRLQDFILPLKKLGIRVSLFLEPDINQIKAAKKVGADIVELHTGYFCDLFEKSRQKEYKNYLSKIELVSKDAQELGLEVHAGHGLTAGSLGLISEIKEIKELNIGHSIISDSISLGIVASVERMRKIIDKSRN
jgi:pyridoxine 5-phosphate synthase